MRTTILAAPVALALGLAVSTASAVQAAPEPETPTADALLYFTVDDVIHGDVDSAHGNRHQLQLDYAEGDVDGYLRSWSCPEGVTVTPTWVSSHCDYRKTQDLREKWATEPDAWLSSTGRSATFDADTLVGVNRATGYRRVISTDLTLHAAPGAEQSAPHVGCRDACDGTAYIWSKHYTWGDFDDADLWDSGVVRFGWWVLS